MKRIILAALPAVALLLPASAVACGTGDGLPIAYIHSALPLSLPEHLIVAEVEIEPVGLGLTPAAWGDRAVVRRMIQGPPVSILILRHRVLIVCGSPYDNGRTGYVIAEPGAYHGADALIVYPIKVSRRDGYRLPEGFIAPPRPAEDLVR